MGRGGSAVVGVLTATMRGMAMCTGMWRDDDGELRFCALERGHQPECTTGEGWLYSETVEMV